MKQSLLIILLMICSLLTAFNSNDYKIYDTHKEKYVELKDIINDLKKSDILFFGEIHNDSLMHYLEYQLLLESQKSIKNLTVSMEMFERDTEPIINAYFSNELTESEFITQSRAWPNYLTDYKPIVELCKSKKLVFIASNVPRRIASLVNKKGLSTLDSLSIQDKNYVARIINTSDGAYKKRFYDLMLNGMKMMPRKMINNNPMLDNLYFAQCVKDDTMAESINLYLIANPRAKIIHYNGEFHSDYHLGTVERIRPEYKSLVISSLIKEKGQPLTISDKDDTNKADYLIIQYYHFLD